jgi:hypothetical protein
MSFMSSSCDELNQLAAVYKLSVMMMIDRLTIKEQLTAIRVDQLEF